MSNVIKCPQSKWSKHFFTKNIKISFSLVPIFYIKKTKINKKTTTQQLKYLKYYYVHCP